MIACIRLLSSFLRQFYIYKNFLHLQGFHSTQKTKQFFMIQKLTIIVTLFVLMIGCKDPHANHTGDAAMVIKLKSLLNQQDYFRLEKQLDESGNKISPSQKLYYRAFLENAFNRNEAAAATIDSLLDGADSLHLTDSAQAALKLLQGDSYFKLFQYVKAAQDDSMVLGRYPLALDSSKIDDVKNEFLIRKALQNTPPQQTFILHNTVTHWTKDALGLKEIPVRSGKKVYSGIFDTRANISSITQTYAKKLGLKILPVSYKEGSGITGNTFKTGLGIADSLYIGDILVRNVVFQVMPDSILYLQPLHFSMNLIIGFPVISQLKEIHIFKDGHMIVPLVETESNLHDFALNGLDPVISLQKGNDTLSFNFDMGATTTTLYYAYFEKYKSEIIKNGIRKKTRFGGAGGIQTKDTYVVPSVDLKMRAKNVSLDSVTILTQKIYPAEKLYGNIGNDFDSNFDELILNFDKMYIKGN